MIIKKGLIFLFCTIFLLQLVVAQEYKIEILTIPEDKIFFEPGETIKLKITLRDSSNNPLDGEVLIIIKDLKEKIIQEETIKSKDIEEIKLDKNALAGEGKIIAKYKNSEATEAFFIAENELAEFKLNGEKLIITNIGNTIYDETIYITIGETTGSKNPNLKIGDSVSYRLIAPEGVYKIKVTDKHRKILFSQGEVQLTGTGHVIGALDERGSQVSGITGISPEKESEGELLGYVKNSKFVYVFVFVIFGAMILLAIEKRYRKKVGQ